MMINKLKLTLTALLAAASIASPAFSQTIHPRHQNVPDRPLYNYAPNEPAAAPNTGAQRPFDPSDTPNLTGGGSPSYNVCAGHASGFGGC
jgi:hypothetical protein